MTPQDIDGILLLDKPLGLSSAGAVARASCSDATTAATVSPMAPSWKVLTARAARLAPTWT